MKVTTKSKSSAKKEIPVPITGVKGFDKNLKCLDMQYEIGKTFEMEANKKLVCCPTNKATEGGLHFCEYPLDVFGYYPPGTSRYAEVTAKGDIARKGDDSKVASTSLHIGVELSLKKIIEGAIKFTFDRVRWTKKNTTHKDGEGATSNGNNSWARAGKGCIATAIGLNSKAAGSIGSWLTITECEVRGYITYIIDAKTVPVDGKVIKADTFYSLKNGKLIKV